MSGMTVAELVARLRADTGDFSRGMRRAEGDLARFDRMAGNSMGMLRRWGQGIETIASTVSLAAAGAITSLAAVGVSYNTLMQKTTAAFTVLLGGAQKANAMVKELTDFARESPFPRQLFIQGAQQLIGFGLAAQKVVPAFEAIEDAVAAVGGGSEEILQFTNIFARIKSLGKANSEELMRFSLVGIDAFKMLAQGSGKSISEIRKQISEGMLGADETIDLLVKGLTEKFGGSAALVKKTWVGAIDRIKGAWRDLGSKMMTPFIDPNGGGAAVEWANQIANALRLLEREVIPPVIERMDEFIAKVVDLTRRVNFEDWLARGERLWEKYGDTLKTFLPILGAVGLGFAKQGLAMVPFVGQMANFIPLPGKAALALMGLVLSSDKGREAVARLGQTLRGSFDRLLPRITALAIDLVDALSDILPPLIDIAGAVLESGLPILATGLEVAALGAKTLLTVVTPLVDLLADHPAIVRAIVSAYAAWKLFTLAEGVVKFASGIWLLVTAQAANTTATAANTAESVANTTSTIARVGAANALSIAYGRLTAATLAQNAAEVQNAISGLYHVGRWTQFVGVLKGSVLPALGRLKTFMMGLGGAGLLGIGIGITAATSILDNAARQATAFKNVNERVFNFDHEKQSLNEWSAEINRLGAEYNEMKRKGERHGILGFAKQGLQNLSPFNKNTITDNRAMAASVEDDLFRVRTEVDRASRVINGFSESVGISAQAGEYLAKTYGIDVTQGAEDLRKALHESWTEVKANGEMHKILGGALGLTAKGYQRYLAAVREAAEGDRRFGRSMGDAIGAVPEGGPRNGVFAAFESAQAALAAMPAQMAEISKAIDQSVQGFLSPMQSWQTGMAQVEQQIQDKHDVFMENLRGQYDRWIEKHTESTVSFDEWAANINGVDFGDFSAEFNKPAMAFDAMLGDMNGKLMTFVAWRDNIRKIAERGGADLAMEIAKWGPEAATLVGEIVKSTDPEFSEFKRMTLETMAATTEGVVLELGLLQALGAEYAGLTVTEIETALGLMPGAVRTIGEQTGDEFDEFMQALAILAENGGQMSADGFAALLNDRLQGNLPQTEAFIALYMDLFELLGKTITETAKKFNLPTITGLDQNGRRVILGPDSRLGTNAADGALFLKSFAAGGVESHFPQIAHGTRMWAEPETGGEAYIPLALSKRARSMDLLAQVARIFGARLVGPRDQGSSFADGGITGGSNPADEFGGGGAGLVQNFHIGSLTRRTLRDLIHEQRKIAMEAGV